MNSKKKILFISHNASRSGAPFVLLYLLQWLKKHTVYQIDLLLLDDGPLRKDFEQVVGNVFLVSNLLAEKSTYNRIKQRIRKTSESERILKVAKKINIKSYSAVYGNTIITLPWLIDFRNKFSVKTIIAIHELKLNMENYFTRDFLTINLPKLDLIIAGSKAVSNNLENVYGVPLSLINVVHAFIHTTIKPNDDKNILKAINIPENRFIIGSVGNAEWRKGTDIFVHMGMYFKKHYPNFNYHLLWVGGDQELIVRNLMVDIQKAGLDDRITIIGKTNRYLDYMFQFDVFAMLSREDPFPLVSLEASLLEKPIIMFEDTGGTAELIINGGGVIVPYLEIEMFADSIVKLSENPQMRLAMGRLLKNEVLNKYDSEIICKKITLIFDNLF